MLGNLNGLAKTSSLIDAYGASEMLLVIWGVGTIVCLAIGYTIATSVEKHLDDQTAPRVVAQILGVAIVFPIVCVFLLWLLRH